MTNEQASNMNERFDAQRKLEQMYMWLLGVCFDMLK